jgi:signal peptidase
MKKIIKDIIGWILYIALLIGLIFGVPKGLIYVLKTNYPMASITSGSMWPVLKRGDLILIKGIESKEEVKVGDIIVYKNPKGFTIHRVVEIKGDTLVTRGDANNVNDTPISYAEIIGELVTINNKPLRVPLLGMVSVFINRNKI